MCTQLHVPTQVHEGDLKFTFPSSSSAAVSSQACAKLQQPVVCSKSRQLRISLGSRAATRAFAVTPGWKGSGVKSPSWSSITWGPTSGEGAGSRASFTCFKSCSWGCWGMEVFPWHQRSTPSVGDVLVLREKEEKPGVLLTMWLVSQTCKHDLSINR